MTEVSDMVSAMPAPLQAEIARLASAVWGMPVERRAGALHAMNAAASPPRQPGVFDPGDVVSVRGSDGRRYQGVVRDPGVGNGHCRVWFPWMPTGEGRDLPVEGLELGRPMRHIATSSDYIIDPAEAQQHLIKLTARIQNPNARAWRDQDRAAAKADHDAICGALSEWAGIPGENLMTELQPAITQQQARDRSAHSASSGPVAPGTDWRGAAWCARQDTPPGMNPFAGGRPTASANPRPYAPLPMPRRGR